MTFSTAPVPLAIKIKWPQLNITVTALMSDQINSNLIELLYNQLPYRSLQSHALVSGDHLYHIIPSEKFIYTPPSHKVPNRATEPDGTIFLSRNQHLAIKYGPLSEYLPAAPCGIVIPNDMAKLRKAGNSIWEACNESAQAIEVIVWDASKDEPTERIPLPIQRMGYTEEVKDLVQEIHTETEKSWSGISPDLEIVHRGQAPSRAGSKESYFPTMVFMNGQVRTLGYTVLNNILRLAETQPHFDLQHLIMMYRVFGSPLAEFVGYMGTDFLWSSYNKIDVLVNREVENNANREEAREDFLAMISAFAQYVTLLNAQNLQLFPWKHASEYPTVLH